MSSNSVVAHELGEPEVYIHVEGNVGIITLNRPKALNALNLTMIREIMPALNRWEQDPKIACVVIEGSGDKAFCAGGDIRAVYAARVKEDRHFNDAIFREEYILNYYISQYKKPYISLINGICMGGGMGLSIHGRYRIVTDNTIMAMPETGIGFFTDIGASYFLNRCSGFSGYYMGLLGEKINAGDAIYTGLGTHFVPQPKFKELRAALLTVAAMEQVDIILDRFIADAPASPVKEMQSTIDAIFSGKTMEDIIKRLETANTPLTNSWLKMLTGKSPTSLKITLKLLQKNKKLPLKDCLPTEFRLSQRCVENYDFFEGIRALLIDKDQQPQWQPRYLNSVSEKQVKSYFAPFTSKELEL